MSAQHIAGMPVEELVLAAIAAATPMIALIAWEIRDRFKRLRNALRRPEGSPEPLPDAASE